jgi:hypothetical protein
MSKRLATSIVFACVLVAILLVVMFRVHGHSKSITTQSSSTLPQVAYSKYINVRFAYSICYPPQILLPQGESPNGDGQKFVSKDGATIAIVYGNNNALGQSLQQIFDQDTEGIKLSDKSIVANKFTFSGRTANDLMEFEETILQNQVLKTFNIQFPSTEMGTYGVVAERMMECFANTAPTQYSE